jgi:hypothetical protein
LLGLINDSEKRKVTTEVTKTEKKEKVNKKEMIDVNFNEDSLTGFNTKSKKLMS